MIRRYEAADKALRAKPLRPLSRAHLDRLKATRKNASVAAKAVSDEINTISERISSLSIDARRRARLPWSRWLSERGTDAKIAELEAQRETLRSQFATLQTASLRAEVKARDAGNALVVAQAEADGKRDTALKLADKRAAILVRARTLLSRVPMLAYVGARRLLAIAARVESARETQFGINRISRL